jgi:hypothetical protein
MEGEDFMRENDRTQAHCKGGRWGCPCFEAPVLKRSEAVIHCQTLPDRTVRNFQAFSPQYGSVLTMRVDEPTC